MPFKSKAQMRLFFAKEKKGELPEGTAINWAHETPNIKSLPEHVKKSCLENFIKIAKTLFDPKKNPPISASVIQTDMIEQTKQQKMKDMSPAEYRNNLTQSRTGIVRRNRQSVKAP